MKITNFKKIGLIVIASITITISSCKKDEHSNEAPVITINKPDNNSTVTYPQSVHVEGTLTDEDALHEASILAIAQGSGDTVLAQYPVVHSKTTYDFHYHFAPAVGIYVVQIIAEDHDGNQASATRTVTVN